MSDCICNDGETIDDLIIEARKSVCRICGKPYTIGDWSYDATMHHSCKEKNTENIKEE